MVPLALNTIAHDRSSFIQETEDEVSTDAAVARARLDNSPDGPLIELLGQVRGAGDGLLIVRSTRQSCHGQVGGRKGHAARQLGAAGRRGGPAGPGHGRGSTSRSPRSTGSWVAAAIPVYSTGAQLVGTVILARSPRRSTTHRRPVGHLGTIAVLAMLAAALLAFALARWVSRPLKGLDAAARRLADGDLAIRTVVGSGPPELRRLGTTFNTMAGRLEALVHGNRAVIADVSHQLRTPLAALRLRLDLLAADAAQSDPATSHELAGALDELARLSRLVDGLLAVARAENVVPVPAAVDIAEVARERVVAWHPVADDRSIVLTADGGQGGGPARRCWPGSARGTWSRSSTT